ncbi:hypothetical protein ACJJTC_003982 [Scirpophaga incertulas]
MGKNNRKRRNSSMEELNERLRNLEKHLAKKSRPDHHKSRDRHCSKPVRTRRIQTPSSSNSSSSGSTHRRRKQSRRIYSSSPSPLHLNFSVSSEKEEGEATVPEQIVATNTGDVEESETLPAAIEEILGQDGLVDNPNSLKLHESLSKRCKHLNYQGPQRHQVLRQGGQKMKSRQQFPQFKTKTSRQRRSPPHKQYQARRQDPRRR